MEQLMTLVDSDTRQRCLLNLALAQGDNDPRAYGADLNALASPTLSDTDRRAIFRVLCNLAAHLRRAVAAHSNAAGRLLPVDDLQALDEVAHLSERIALTLKALADGVGRDDEAVAA